MIHYGDKLSYPNIQAGGGHILPDLWIGTNIHDNTGLFDLQVRLGLTAVSSRKNGIDSIRN